MEGRGRMDEGHVHSPLCGDRDRIVVGVDRSASSAAALRWAGQEARLRRTHLHVVHAWDSPGRRPQAEELMRDMLTEAFTRLEAGVEQLTVQSRPAEALTAASHGAAMLVVGSHVRGAFSEVFKSVSRRAAAFASCPVVAVREGQDRPPRCGTVVVGVDDSFTSRDALQWAAAEALHRKARLKVVHTVVPLPRTAPWTEGEAREMLTQMLAGILVGPLANVRVSTETGPGEPGGTRAVRSRASSALIAAAQHGDLLVVGSHGYGSVSGALTGSVTSDCLRAAACPVVIIPQAREDQRNRIRAARIAMERLGKTGQCRQPHPLRELEVVADHHGHRADRQARPARRTRPRSPSGAGRPAHATLANAQREPADRDGGHVVPGAAWRKTLPGAGGAGASCSAKRLSSSYTTFAAASAVSSA